MRKTLIISFVLFLVVAGLYFSIPRIIKYYIERNSKALTGRIITLERVTLNPLEGILSFNNISMLEKDDRTLFAKCEKIMVDVDLWKGFKNVFYLESLVIQNPFISIIQSKNGFNFDDLYNRFAESPSSSKSPDSSAFYEINGLVISNGQLSYRNSYLKSLINIIHCNIYSPLLTSEGTVSSYTFDLAFTGGGTLRGEADIDLDKKSYRTHYDLQNFNLTLLYPYVKDYMDVVNFRGSIGGEQTLRGRWDHPEAIALKGSLRAEGIELTDNHDAGLVTAKAMEVVIDSLDVANDLYHVRSLYVSEPYLRLELYKDGTNFDKLMTSYAQGQSHNADSLSTSAAYGNIFGLLATYIKTIAKEYSITNYKVENLLFEKGVFAFNDFTLHRKFEYQMSDLRIKAERLNSKDQRIKFVASSTLNMYGKLNGDVSVDPKKYEDMEIHYTIDSLHVADFNPYTNYFVAHPFLTGMCSYECSTSINNRFIKSDNKIFIKNVTVGKKEKNATAMNLPVRLAVALLRDVNGDIRVEVPIQGDLNDPKYKLGKVIWGIVVNLVKKTAAAPGKLLARKTRMNENFLRGFAWKPLQSELSKEQKKSLDAIAEAVEKSPGLEVELLQVLNEPRELDELAVFTTKKMYLDSLGRLSETKGDTINLKAINELSVNDSLYNKFLSARTRNAELRTAYEMSIDIVGKDKLQRAMEELNEQRTQSLREYLSEAKGLNESQFEVMMSSNKDEAIPYEEPSRCVSKFGAEGG